MRGMVILFVLLSFCGNIYAEEFSYPFDAIENRDPLSPLVNDKGDIIIKEDAPGTDGNINITLQGILFSEDNASVIISGEIYHENDMIGKCLIKKIMPNGIFIVIDENETFIKWEG